MVEYLKGTPHPLPEVVSAPSGKDASLAVVDPGFERGEVFLRDEEKQIQRLVWDEPSDAAASRRSLPPGRYDLVGYRIVQKQGDDTWHVSVSGKSIRSLNLKADRENKLRIKETIRIAKRLGKKRVGMAVWGEDKAGLSIYKNGKRIPMSYRTLDESGATLDAGPMEYG